MFNDSLFSQGQKLFFFYLLNAVNAGDLKSVCKQVWFMEEC